jgi:general secretion pathway protein G
LLAARGAGFSLVEILLVILIIVMLAGALVVYVLPQQEGAQRDTTMLKLRNIQKALDVYKLNIGSYPSEEQGGLRALVERPTFENEKLAAKWNGPYLERGTPLDDAWGFLLVYELIDKSLVDDKSGPDFRLFSVGPDGVRETDDDLKLFDENAPAGLDGTDAPAGVPATSPGPAPPATN